MDCTGYKPIVESFLLASVKQLIASEPALPDYTTKHHTHYVELLRGKHNIVHRRLRGLPFCPSQ